MKKTTYILGLVGLFIVIFLAAEFITRKVYGDRFLTLVDPYLHHPRRPYLNIERSWWSGRNFKFITNSLGWRDKIPQHQIGKFPDKTRRIVFLGDSFTEGIGYNQEETFSGVVEQNLKKSGYDWEVLNGGTTSYSPLLYYLRLKQLLEEGYKIDLVVIATDRSDVQDEVLYDYASLFNENDEFLQFNQLVFSSNFLTKLANSSCIIRATTLLFQDKIIPWLSKTKERFYGYAEVTDPLKVILEQNIISVDELIKFDKKTQTLLRPNWTRHEPSLKGWAQNGILLAKHNMKKIKDLCEDANIKLMIVMYPWPQALYTKKDPDYYKVLEGYFGHLFKERELFYGKEIATVPSKYEQVVESFCTENAVSCVNMIAQFRKTQNWHELFIPSDPHFSDKGHRLAGDILTPYIIEKLKPK